LCLHAHNRVVLAKTLTQSEEEFDGFSNVRIGLSSAMITLTLSAFDGITFSGNGNGNVISSAADLTCAELVSSPHFITNTSRLNLAVALTNAGRSANSVAPPSQNDIAHVMHASTRESTRPNRVQFDIS
jgi:hypothetical protein